MYYEFMIMICLPYNCCVLFLSSVVKFYVSVFIPQIEFRRHLSMHLYPQLKTQLVILRRVLVSVAVVC